MNPVSFLIGALFALVFVTALASWWRRRDAIGAATVLVFAAMSVVFVLVVLQAVMGPPPAQVLAAAIVLLLGQPVFTLILAAQVHRVRRPILVVATGAWLLTSLPLAVVGTESGGAPVLAAVAAFVITELGAAAYLMLEARQRRGAAAIRLWTASAATVLFAVAIFAAGAGAAGDAVPAMSQLASFSALLAAVGYLVAFLPPEPVRRVWQAATAYRGLRSLMDTSSSRPAEIWDRFLEIATASTGSTVAAVIVGPGAPGSGQLVIAATGLPASILGEPVYLAAGPPGEEVPIGDAIANDPLAPLGAAAGHAGAWFVRTIDLGSDPDAPSLVLFSSRRSLFAEEDRTLLSALGRQAAVMAAHRRLTADLASTVEALRSASQAKSDFLASMSHELRTPLNAILGFSDLMRTATPEPDGTIRASLEWVEHIHRGGTHLVELVNDVLDLSRVEAGRLELDPEPIGVLVATTEAVAGLRPLADRKGHTIAIDVAAGEAVLADRGRLRQILYNLLSNAIKFTPPDGRISIEGRRLEDDYHLSVSDTGVGIAPEDLARVFDEFRQVGASAQRTEGSGLGLALTRRLVEAHGGRLELASTPGVGSRFTVVLPVATGPSAAGGAAPVTPRDEPAGALATPGTVLIVEDDPSAIRLLRAFLEPEGWLVEVATDGDQGLAAARAVHPQAILLDVLLPGIDGWEVLRRLKADAGLRDIPVVIVTVVDERNVGLALGAVDYLVKPIEREALLGSLARLALTRRLPERSVRILVVDDEPAVLDMLEGALRPAGFDVVCAGSGRDGISLARRLGPDLVICDLVMPDIDGFGVVADLKADPATADVPILILTAHDLSQADKDRLNGKVLAIVVKGPDAEAGLRTWLARVGARHGP